MPEERRLEEQFISQEAERRLSNQLDEAEQINVDVQTDLFKIVQGQVDGVSLSGQGLVIFDNIRVQEIKLQTDSIAVNPLSAIFGQIELNAPVNAIARIVMTELDINQALNSEFVQSSAKNYDLNVEGEIVSFEMQKMQLSLPEDDKIQFQGLMQIKEKGNTRPLGFTARFRPRTHVNPIILESFDCHQGEGVTLEIVAALVNKVKELVNLPYLTWEGTKFKIINMEIKQHNLIVLIETQIRQIPPSLSELSS
jgi:LmeA-like phospholipid-binding